MMKKKKKKKKKKGERWGGGDGGLMKKMMRVKRSCRGRLGKKKSMRGGRERGWKLLAGM